MGKIKDFVLNHKAVSFIVIMCLIIILNRIGVLIYDASPIIFQFELHHFNYGLLILLAVSILLLFGRKRYFIYYILTAIAFGLILDDLWFIRGNILEQSGSLETFLYNNTFPAVVFLTILAISTVLLINYLREKKKLK